jgi:hypothetical protein
MRQAGDVGYSEVFRDRGEVSEHVDGKGHRGRKCTYAARLQPPPAGHSLYPASSTHALNPDLALLSAQVVGVAEYSSREDLERAITKLNGSRFA